MASTPTSGLKWVRVNLPQYRRPGELAQLQCDYDLGNDTLYAVKWYKENEEFYRFVLKERPQANSYKVEGVHVDVSHEIIINKNNFHITFFWGGKSLCEEPFTSIFLGLSKSCYTQFVICVSAK